jgi:hypothetical protein
MAQSGLTGQLQFLAPDQRHKCCTLFSGVWRNAKVTHVQSTTGHMLHQKDTGCISRHSYPTPHESMRDLFICVYKLKKTKHPKQTGLFPQVSSLGNKYIMVIHNVDSNSLWVEALKDNTGSKLILGRARALEHMRKVYIIPKHQILDNQASAAYKKAIGNSYMTYELVPPDDHLRNMAKKAIKTFKAHFVGVFSGCAPTLPLHLWCQLLPQVEWQLLLLQNCDYIPTYPPMHMSMAIMTTTTIIHLFQLGWRHLYTTNHTNVAPMQNTAKRCLPLACPPNTIGVQNSG